MPPDPRRWFLDPKFYEDTDDAPLVKRATQRLKKTSDREIARLVDQWLDDQLSREDFILLEMLEDRATPALVAALRSPRITKYEVPPDGFGFPPLEKLWTVLEPLRPPEAVPVLARLLDHPSYWARATTAFQIGYICTPNAIAALQRAVADPETHVMTMAMNGIAHAISRVDFSGDLRKKLFDIAASQLDRFVVGGSNVARTLMAIDAQRGATLIQDPARLRLGNPTLPDLLQALAEAKVVVPAAQIAALCAELKREESKQAVAYAYALQVLARSGDPTARKRIESAMKSRVAFVRDLAPQARSILENTDDAHRVALDALAEVDSLQKLAPPLRTYLAVTILKGEVENGGFEQYFANSSGDDWREALAGLKEIGAKKTVALLKEVIAMFDDSTPSPKRKTRVEQMNRWNSKQVARLRKIEDAFYKDPDRLTERLADYTIKHRTHFQRSKA
jgi:HEAT repeat protein